jgi:hypothetical protein
MPNTGTDSCKLQPCDGVPMKVQEFAQAFNEIFVSSVLLCVLIEILFRTVWNENISIRM